MIELALPPRLLLVRHGWAGTRSDDPVADRRRPLDDVGRRQATGLPGHLVDVLGPDLPTIRLLSSPLRRCVDTLRPMATAWHLEIPTDERLAEGVVPLHATDTWPEAAWYGSRGLEAISAAVRVNPPAAPLVVCSHGEVLPALLAALTGHLRLPVPAGIDLAAKAMPKGGSWLVDLDRAEVRAIAPPEVDDPA